MCDPKCRVTAAELMSNTCCCQQSALLFAESRTTNHALLQSIAATHSLHNNTSALTALPAILKPRPRKLPLHKPIQRGLLSPQPLQAVLLMRCRLVQGQQHQVVYCSGFAGIPPHKRQVCRGPHEPAVAPRQHDALSAGAEAAPELPQQVEDLGVVVVVFWYCYVVRTRT